MSYYLQRAKELKSYPDKIEKRLKGIKNKEKKRQFLLEVLKLFVVASGRYSYSRKKIMDFLSEKYSSTFKNPTEGYYEFFRKTGYFVNDMIPIEYAFMKQMEPEDITCHYYPHINNVKFLLTKYSMNTIVSSYAKKKKKIDVIGALMDIGYSINDIKKEKIYLSKKQHDELFGW